MIFQKFQLYFLKPTTLQISGLNNVPKILEYYIRNGHNFSLASFCPTLSQVFFGLAQIGYIIINF